MAYIYIYIGFGPRYFLILGLQEYLSLITKYVGNRNKKVGVIGCQINFLFLILYLGNELFKKAIFF
jgi:hypothetical protein